MSSIESTLAADHRACDEHFAQAEAAAAAGDLPAARAHLARFLAAMERHLRAEEALLFPAFEERTGMPGGPTSVMRHEHAQMRELFGELQATLEAGDAPAFLGATETLLFLMQQHNMKEENMLYPMSDRALGADAEALAERLRAYA